MIWNSASEFFAMGGYGLYVWGSFGMCAVAMILEPVTVARREKSIVQSLRRRVQANKFDKEDQQ